MTPTELRQALNGEVAHYRQCHAGTDTSRKAARAIVRALADHPWLSDQVPGDVLRLAWAECHRCDTLEQVLLIQEPMPADAPYARDWHVRFIVDHGPGQPYRWSVAGINANCAPGEYGRIFYWHVPRLDWRYDLSKAQLVPVASYTVTDDPSIGIAEAESV